MTKQALELRVRELCAESVALPGHGQTAQRHARLFAVGREDLSVVKLVEAHWDAVAILAEAGRQAEPGAVYGVWASEAPGAPLRLVSRAGGEYAIAGKKAFCSGGTMLDRALVTVVRAEHEEEHLLVDVDLRRAGARIAFDGSAWCTAAFALTETGAASFDDVMVPTDMVVGAAGFYLERAGFWHGACGPAACWAGGVAGLLDAAMLSRRSDPHTLAHLGAMRANVWGMQALLAAAGAEIDAAPEDRDAAYVRALELRHLIEQMATDTLRRFARAYGPQPLAMNEEVSRRYLEADLFLRQVHGERDLEALGNSRARS